MSRERQPEQQEVKGWQVLLSQLLGGWKTPDGSQQAQQILDEMDYPSFASLLPYRRYDPDSELFVNARTAGFILECAPLSGANEAISKSLDYFLRDKIPRKVPLTFMLVGSPCVRPMLERGLADFRWQGKRGDEFNAVKASQMQTAATSSSPVASAVPERRDYRLPDGRVVNLKNYKLVLFMQSRCGYCQQFDPLLKRVTTQIGLDVFPYTLDGMGDASFPDAIPATEAVIRDMWSNMRPVTPAAFLVEVNTLKTLPLLYGIVDEQTLRQRIDEALEFANAAVTGTGSSMKASPEFPH